MDPLDEKELSPLLRQWKAPETPADLGAKVRPHRFSIWRWLTTGSIRIPVPVGLAALAILLVWMLYSRPAPVPVVEPAASNTLADFQPVQQLEPKIIGGTDDTREQQQK